MASAIDPAKPADGVAAVKADLRANLLAAKNEIEALQAIGPGSGDTYTRSEAGAVQRSLVQLAQDQGMNVKEFGALGDGSGTTIQQWLSGGSKDRGFADLAAVQAVYPHAEALTDTIDWVVLQQCCDLAAQGTGAARVYMPGGVYVINRTLQVTRGNGSFETVLLQGEPHFPGASNGTQIEASSFLDAPALAISGARYVELKDFAVEGGNFLPLTTSEAPTDVEADWVTAGCTTGQFTVYCGIAVDPYSGGTPAGGGYPLAAGESYGRNLSNMVRFDQVAVRYFVAAWAITPADQPSQGDFITWHHCNVDFCAYGITSGGTQNRDMTIFGGQIYRCREALVNNRHGQRTGNIPYAVGVGMFRLYRVLQATDAYASGLIVGCRSESIHEIGVWWSGSEVHHPLMISGCDYTFGVPGMDPQSAVHLYSSAPVHFTACNLYPYIFENLSTPSHPGFVNVGGGGEIVFDSCFFRSKGAWPDRIYVASNGNFGSPRVELRNCSFFSDKMTSGNWAGSVPGQNSLEKRTAGLPARAELNGHSRRMETNTAPYFVQLGDNAPTSAASGYSHGTAEQVSFTAASPSDFVAHAAGSAIPGDILYWQDTIYGAVVPMLRVSAVSGSTVTCEKLFADAMYDTGYNPANIVFVPRQWAPGSTLTGTTSGSSTAATLSASGVVEAGDWITDGSNVRRVASVSGSSLALTAAVDWSGGVEVWWARLRQLSFV